MSPSSGRRAGRPAARVLGLGLERFPDRAPLTHALAVAQEQTRVAASGTTNAEGWYFLDYPTRVTHEVVEVRAEIAELDGTLGVTLPREPEVLPALVLGPQPTVLVVRVPTRSPRASRSRPTPRGRS